MVIFMYREPILFFSTDHWYSNNMKRLYSDVCNGVEINFQDRAPASE
jgi:hypothetical protein